MGQVVDIDAVTNATPTVHNEGATLVKGVCEIEPPAGARPEDYGRPQKDDFYGSTPAQTH
jgi:hypothetical protein